MFARAHNVPKAYRDKRRAQEGHIEKLRSREIALQHTIEEFRKKKKRLQDAQEKFHGNAETVADIQEEAQDIQADITCLESTKEGRKASDAVSVQQAGNTNTSHCGGAAADISTFFEGLWS